MYLMSKAKSMVIFMKNVNPKYMNPQTLISRNIDRIILSGGRNSDSDSDSDALYLAHWPFKMKTYRCIHNITS